MSSKKSVAYSHINNPEEFPEYNQQDATFLKFIYFCKRLYMFQTVFPSIIRSSFVLLMMDRKTV